MGDVIGRPTVSVAIIAYNHKDFIRECLESIVAQKGDFRLEVMVFDDCSTDGTLDVVRLFMHDTVLPKNMSLEILPTKTNLGMVKNLERLVKTCAAKNNEFATIVDGDDYYFSTQRVQKHIDFLNENKQYPFSFNSLMCFSPGENRWTLFSTQVDYIDDAVAADFLADDNIIGNIGCSFFRTVELRNLPKGLFELFCGDWFLHLAVANGRDFGFLHEPLSVYRIHSASIWKGESAKTKADILAKSILEFNQVTHGMYSKALLARRKVFLGEMVKIPKPKKEELVIIDDAFPHRGSSFRTEEFEAYLKAFKNIHIFCNGGSYSVFDNRTKREIEREYFLRHPENKKKVSFIPYLSCEFNAALAYFCFLGNAWLALPGIEESKTPFVFELYPGGSFARNNAKSDSMLKDVVSSPYFRKVITTQAVTTRYLLEKKFCKKEQIVEMFGVVTPKNMLEPYQFTKKHFGYEKSQLDIVFAAFLYSKTGKDKGYDVFVKVAEILLSRYSSVYFHVVGGCTKETIDVHALEGHIQFYGKQIPSWFDGFYQDKDLILSPNIPGVLSKGAFDGFPTASCTEAALRDVAIFATDPLKMNEGRFADGEEIEIVPHDAQEIVKRIEYYMDNPARLKALAQGSGRAVRRIYGEDQQIKPRIALLKAEIKAAKVIKVEKEEKQEVSLEKINPIEFCQNTLYAKSVSGKIVKLRNVCSARNEQVELVFNLPKKGQPFEEFNCVLADPGCITFNMGEALADEQSLVVNLHNGIDVDGLIYFPHSTPQIICSAANKEPITAKKFIVRGQFVHFGQDAGKIAWELKEALAAKANRKAAEVSVAMPQIFEEQQGQYCKLYLSTGRAYSEDMVINAKCNFISKSIWHVQFDLPCDLGGKFIKALRFDPVEGRTIKCEILQFCVGEKHLTAKRCNGIGAGKRKRFTTKDPWYEFVADFHDAKTVECVFQMMDI